MVTSAAGMLKLSFRSMLLVFSTSNDINLSLVVFLLKKKGCERGESNPHGDYPLDPKSSASTNSATFACFREEYMPFCETGPPNGGMIVRSRATQSPPVLAKRKPKKEPWTAGDRPNRNGTRLELFIKPQHPPRPERVSPELAPTGSNSGLTS